MRGRCHRRAAPIPPGKATGTSWTTCRDSRPPWNVFAEECADTIAPEATYQAWLAHFLMEQFGVLRVVREIDFGSRHLDLADQARFTGSNLMADVMVLREPQVSLPRRAQLAPPGPPGEPTPRSGLERLKRFAIISELKVGSSQGLGLTCGQVVRDFHKLDAILRAAQRHYPQHQLPTAVVCILDNNDNHRLDREHLVQLLEADPPTMNIKTLNYPAASRRPTTGHHGERPQPASAPRPDLYRVDQDSGSVVFGDGESGTRPPMTSGPAPSYRHGAGTAGDVSAEAPSALRRLLDEISWEGNARKYRGGGGHLEKVVTAEVFAKLDFLPRSDFLAAALLRAHGAEAARVLVAARSEEAVVDVLPGALSAWISGEATGWHIQPDVLISSHGLGWAMLKADCG